MRSHMKSYFRGDWIHVSPEITMGEVGRALKPCHVAQDRTTVKDQLTGKSTLTVSILSQAPWHCFNVSSKAGRHMNQVGRQSKHNKTRKFYLNP